MSHIEIVVTEPDDFPLYEMVLRGGVRRFLDRRQIQAESKEHAGMAQIVIGDRVIEKDGADPRRMNAHDREVVAGMLYTALPEQRDEY